MGNPIHSRACVVVTRLRVNLMLTPSAFGADKRSGGFAVSMSLGTFGRLARDGLSHRVAVVRPTLCSLSCSPRSLLTRGLLGVGQFPLAEQWARLQTGGVS